MKKGCVRVPCLIEIERKMQFSSRPFLSAVEKYFILPPIYRLSDGEEMTRIRELGDMD